MIFNQKHVKTAEKHVAVAYVKRKNNLPIRPSAHAGAKNEAYHNKNEMTLAIVFQILVCAIPP